MRECDLKPKRGTDKTRSKSVKDFRVLTRKCNYIVKEK
jgi:hypothetical protein